MINSHLYDSKMEKSGCDPVVFKLQLFKCVLPSVYTYAFTHETKHREKKKIEMTLQ